MIHFLIVNYLWGVGINVALVLVVFMLSGFSWEEVSAKYKAFLGIDVSPTGVQWRLAYQTILWPIDTIFLLIRLCRTGSFLPKVKP